MKPLMLVGIIVVIIALIIAALSVAGNKYDGGALGDDNQLMDFDCTSTIYVKNSAGIVYSASINLDGVTFEEGMMLSFGQGIRQTSFAPLETSTSTIPNIVKSANDYSLWTKTTILAEGFDITKYDKVSTTCSGYAGATQASGNPDHITSSNALCTSAKVTSVTVTQTNINPTDDGGGVYSLNEFTLDQSSSGVFSNCLSTAGGSFVNSNKLLGDQIDGATLHVTIIGTVTLDNGGTETASVDADLKISVNSWTSSTLSCAVTSLSYGG